MKLARIANRIFICDIYNEKIKKFTDRFLKYFGKSKLAVIKNKDDMGKALSECKLLVNATPFGRKKGEVLIKSALLHKGLKIFDLIYKPSETPIMKAARKLGIKAVGGLDMLLYQGAASFQLWTGRKAPIETMRRALMMALKR